MSLTAEQRERLDERIRKKGGYFSYGFDSSEASTGVVEGEVEVKREQ